MNLETKKNNQILDQKNSQISQKIFDPNLPEDDLLAEFMEVDKDYTYKRQVAYLEYERAFSKYLKPNFFTNYFMTFKENYLKFTHLVTKNAILATLIMLLALSTVSASAAQLLAPDEYKPKTLINNLNKKEEKNQNSQIQAKPLIADSQSDVVVLKECDLAVQFSKKVQRQTLFELKPYSFDSSYYSKFLTPQKYVSFRGGEGSGPGAGFSVECYDKAYSVENFSKEFVNLNKKGYFEAIDEFGKSKIEKLDKQEFCKQASLTEASCQKDLKNTTKIQVPSSESSLIYYFMNYENKTYLIEKGLFANDSKQKETLTIQFDFLAPSKSSIEISQIQKVENQSSSSSTNSQKSQVSSRQSSSQKSESKNSTSSQSTLKNSSINNQNEEKNKNNLGKITGTIIYPSEYLPMQRVCAESLQKVEQKCIDTTSKNFEMELPEGKYYVYVKGTLENGKFIESFDNGIAKKVYFNKYILQCMMKQISCLVNNQVPQEYHTTLNVVNVETGKTIQNVNPWDWYYVTEQYADKN
jgi:hypothetical protein